MGASFEALLFLSREGTMTEQKKAGISRLRLAGHSYTQIAEILHLSRNTVKSVCQRYGFKKGVTPEIGRELGVCQNCGMRVTQPQGQKHRNFCSDACRRAWWKAHRDSGKKKTAIQVRCASCGRMFEDYTRNHRKYCCHGCYIRDRFGEKKPNDKRAV